MIPLRLTGSTFAVYQQLDDKAKSDVDQIKPALVTAFAMDSFMAYKQLIEQHLQYGESMDVYLSELMKLSFLMGRISDSMLGCAFVHRLPGNVKWTLALVRMNVLSVDQLLTQVIMRDETEEVMVAAQPIQSMDVQVRKCFQCNGINHMVKDCRSRQNDGGRE